MSLLNDVIVGSYAYPTSSSIYGRFSNSVNPFVVNGTVETVLTVDGNVTTDVKFSADSLVLTLLPREVKVLVPLMGRSLRFFRAVLSLQ
jgi:hypothetical protein